MYLLSLKFVLGVIFSPLDSLEPFLGPLYNPKLGNIPQKWGCLDHMSGGTVAQHLGIIISRAALLDKGVEKPGSNRFVFSLAGKPLYANQPAFLLPRNWPWTVLPTLLNPLSQLSQKMSGCKQSSRMLISSVLMLGDIWKFIKFPGPASIYIGCISFSP